MGSLTGHLACRPASCPLLVDANRRRRGRLAVNSLRGGSYTLARNASGDAESDAKCAPNGLRLHFDLMVTACLPAGLSNSVCQLPVALRRRKK
jgi:hypothetical protein